MYTLFICTSTSSFSYTLIKSLSEDPRFARLDIEHFILWSGFVEIVHVASSWSLYLFWYYCLSLFLLLFFDSCISDLLLFHFLFHLRSRVDIICIIAVILILHSDYIARSGYFRLSVYTWDIFLAYIRRRLSSRLCFHVFWEVGHETRAWNKHKQNPSRARTRSAIGRSQKSLVRGLCLLRPPGGGSLLPFQHHGDLTAQVDPRITLRRG